MCMKISKRNIIVYSIALLAVIVAVFTVIQKQKLKKQLELIKAERNSFSKESIIEERLFRIDSLLIRGDYNAALNAYEQQFSISETDGRKNVLFRINVAKQFVDLYKNNTKASLILDSIKALDTLVSKNDVSLGVRTFDSLTFALEKTKVQLERVKKQLKRKSYSEYLTFRNPKKHQLHYIGQVTNNKANGYGIAVFDTGSRYEGAWENNLRKGEGSFYWSDGEFYKGEYDNDLRNGLGTYYWPNGEKYVGQWKDDQRNGEGVFYNKDGKIVTSGIWKKDKLVEEFKKKNK